MNLRCVCAMAILVASSVTSSWAERLPIPDTVRIPSGITPLMPTRETLATFRRGHVQFGSVLINYRLFVPKSVDDTKVPLIAWIHGHGDLELHVEDGQLNYVEHLFNADPPLDEHLFVVAMQCPSGYPWFSNDTHPDVLDTYSELIKILIELYPIDDQRVYAVGISSGAAATWELAKRHPEVVAAIAPFAGGPVNPQGLGKIRELPVWAFHSSRDKDTDVHHSIRAIDAFNSAGGSGRLTLVDSLSHDCWTSAFRDFNVAHWLLRQRLGQRANWDIHTRYLIARQNWAVWQLAVQFAIPIFICLICISYLLRPYLRFLTGRHHHTPQRIQQNR